MKTSIRLWLREQSNNFKLNLAIIRDSCNYLNWYEGAIIQSIFSKII